MILPAIAVQTLGNGNALNEVAQAVRVVSCNFEIRTASRKLSGVIDKHKVEVTSSSNSRIERLESYNKYTKYVEEKGTLIFREKTLIGPLSNLNDFGNGILDLYDAHKPTDGLVVINLENDVVRPALLLHHGEVLPPPPVKEPAPAPKPPPAAAKPKQQQLQSPTRSAWGSTVGGLIVIVLLFLLGRWATPWLRAERPSLARRMRAAKGLGA